MFAVNKRFEEVFGWTRFDVQSLRLGMRELIRRPRTFANMCAAVVQRAFTGMNKPSIDECGVVSEVPIRPFFSMDGSSSFTCSVFCKNGETIQCEMEISSLNAFPLDMGGFLIVRYHQEQP
jgi:hypothetical protein